MIPVVSAPRRDGLSSFQRLATYLTVERRGPDEEEMTRGPVVISDSLLSLETAAKEMRQVATMNPRVGDPILHFQLSWRNGEKPTETQWQTAAQTAIKTLGFEQHQFMIVAHDDTAHFHVHVMLNRVHPETYQAHNPRLSLLSLHKVARLMEHEFGWEEDAGLYRWDKTLQQPVRVAKDEMIRHRQNAERPRDGDVVLRGRMERFNDNESVRSFAADKPARALKQLLQRNPTWQEVHALLGRHGLEIHAGEKGGFSVNVTDSPIKVKASEVFRFAFSGKAARERTATILGTYEPSIFKTALAPPVVDYDHPPTQQRRQDYAKRIRESRPAGNGKIPAAKTINDLRDLSSIPVVPAGPEAKMLLHTVSHAHLPDRRTVVHHRVRRGNSGNQEVPGASPLLAGRVRYAPVPPQAKPKPPDPRKMQRESRVEERAQERKELKAEYAQVRAEHCLSLHQHTQRTKQLRQQLWQDLRDDKYRIRQIDTPWQVRKAMLSQRTMEFVLAKQALEGEVTKERKQITRQTYQQWVEEKAAVGDKRAVAQLRGWRYQDQRNLRRAEAEIEAGKRHLAGQIASSAERGTKRTGEVDWEILANDRMRRLRQQEAIPALAAMRWKANIRSGDVTYSIAGTDHLVDRGKSITVLHHDANAVRIALEMAVYKYGRTIHATGSDLFQKQLLQAAVQGGMDIAFTDPHLQVSFIALQKLHSKQSSHSQHNKEHFDRSR